MASVGACRSATLGSVTEGKPTSQAPPALYLIHTTGPKAIAWQDVSDAFRLCVISAMYSDTTQLIAATL